MPLRRRRRAQEPGRQFELDVAGSLGGRVQPASGAFWWAPADLSLEGFLAECKTRTPLVAKGQTQITIKRAWLDKVFDEATLAGRWPLVLFRFADDSRTYAVLPLEALTDVLIEHQRRSAGRDGRDEPSR